MVQITVVGSISMDLVVTADRRPQAGETILGHSFKTVPGGKGANQAVAAARLGAKVNMVGCVGDDVYGPALIENLRQNHVSTQYVEPVTHCSSGTAHITLAEGDNSIIFIKGANDFVTPDYVEKAKEAFEGSSIVLIQQEIPYETVEYVAKLCEKKQIPLLLNPAPARKISPAILEKTAYLTPNEHECNFLFNGIDRSEALKRHPNQLIITEGKNGARFYDGREEIVVPSFPVETVDTTGAGDTFNAAFAVAVAEGKEIKEALLFANRAASLSVTKFGAQGGMPTREEVDGRKR
ncbi:ribokinase [Weizmannia coagulans]|jgi:ribokinase|uniref:Ribokinase n=3 Tax=Heyndrickxia TaxID=2837504 RepID=G2TI28_HEYCO|nr:MULTISPECIES: ribokinase [Heyndrickxia]NWN95349.1 ribokinase [Bacillus sp. (in: firmicutes)]AEP00961.1 ribokinase [Heyndrickxia coagulans 36D1]AJO21398.1 ribokinase [Heyndrickxia coagulans]AKN52975.1 Ribokinase [Heyndrickxia coagulans]APB37333.1 ribokinase [Heyndrickxia coagulans]